MKKLAWIVFSSLVGLASADNYTWKSVTMGGGGFVNAVIAHPKVQNLFYARTDVGGAYRWEESTQSWTPLLDWVSIDETGYLGVDGLAVDPQNVNRVYMLVGTSYWNGGKSAVLRSNDKGATFVTSVVTSQFTANGNGMGRQSGERLAVDPHKSNILFCATRSNGLFKSLDSGATWSPVSSLPVTSTSDGIGLTFVHFDTANGSNGTATSRIWVGVSRTGSTNLYYSGNAGASWTAVNGTPSDAAPRRIAQAGTNLYITYSDQAGPWNANSGYIYKISTSNTSITNITPVAGYPYSGISIDPTNTNRLIATTLNKYLKQPWDYGDHIYYSTNGGTSWTDMFNSNMISMDANGFSWIPNHAIHWAGTITFDPYNTSRVFVTSGNGIFMTSNFSTSSSSTWKFAVKGLEETVPLDAVSLNNGTFVSVIGDYDGFVHTNLAISPAIHNPSIGTTSGIAAAGAAQTNLVRTGNKKIYYTNTGSNWSPIAIPSAQDSGGRVGMSANGKSILYCGNGRTTIYRTSNYSTWTTVSGLSFNTVPVGDQVNASKFYAYNTSSGAFYASTDSGKTFSNKVSLNSGGSTIIRATPGFEGDVWVALYNNGLTHTTNSGMSFTKVSGVSAASAVGLGKAASGKSYPSVYIWGTVNNVTGLFRSDDQGAMWTRINDDAHEFGGPGNGQFVLGDMGTYGRVFMSTVGRGIIYGDRSATANSAPTDISLSATSIDENMTSGSTIGLLTATDLDAGNTFTYTLATGAGSTDNSSFSISGTSLLTTASFDYESKNSYAIRIRVTDQGGLYYEEAFTISVNNVLEASSSSQTPSSSSAMSSSENISSSDGLSSSSESTTPIIASSLSNIKPSYFVVYNMMGIRLGTFSKMPERFNAGNYIVHAFDENGHLLKALVISFTESRRQ